jgi:hypothetical protein
MGLGLRRELGAPRMVPAQGFRSLRKAGVPDWADQVFEQLRLANGAS